MSILLEALRKSEKNRHLREAPSIHTDNQSEPASESIPTGLLVLLLVAGLFVSGWFVWHQYQPPAGSYQPPVTLAVDRDGVEPKPEPEPVVADQGEMEVATSRSKASVSSRRNRTPVETYEPPEGGDRLSDSGEPPPVAVNPTTTTGEETKNSQLTFKPVTHTGPGETHSNTAARGEPVRAAPEKYHPGEPEPIGYWDLPDSVRADIPEIKFSVLVYAAKPADRFVLINGQRLEEGDTAQPGLEVKEIRRDGVIFSYRLYQFLVER